mmetsp:Transcript_51562/g.144123  ORF Transcript_51562/g.144123 Transcript_51562/m.144123 type:complete len:268 (+) Transcript_51562:347-1150(+)
MSSPAPNPRASDAPRRPPPPQPCRRGGSWEVGKGLGGGGRGRGQPHRFAGQTHPRSLNSSTWSVSARSSFSHTSILYVYSLFPSLRNVPVTPASIVRTPIRMYSGSAESDAFICCKCFCAFGFNVTTDPTMAAAADSSSADASSSASCTADMYRGSTLPWPATAAARSVTRWRPGGVHGRATKAVALLRSSNKWTSNIVDRRVATRAASARNGLSRSPNAAGPPGRPPVLKPAPADSTLLHAARTGTRRTSAPTPTATTPDRVLARD